MLLTSLIVVLGVILLPVRWLWKIVFRPITIVLYKAYIIFGERLKTFFHAQHKLLSVVTHRFAIHVLVLSLALGVVTTNIVQAESVRADEFGQGSIMTQIIKPGGETIVTAASAAVSPTSYVSASGSVKSTQGIDGDIGLPFQPEVITAAGSSALVKSNVLSGGVSGSRGDIETYVVQAGDTASTIAAEFGVSTKTILWSNNLSDASLIKPGQTLNILPTTGVAHTVKSGETIDGIAQKYSTTADKIIEFNNFIDASDLIAGVEIIIPDGEQPAPPPPPKTTQLASVRSVFSGSTTPVGGNAAAVSGGSYQWPTSCTRISQYYGYRHTGIDIDCEFDDPIYAAEAGTVVSAGWGGGYGIQVVISHSNGTQTRYAHLSRVDVSAGQTVSKGQWLGPMGSTGYSTGSHLHYEVIVGGSTVNPFSYH